jgi:hypothetical protein
MCGAANRFTEFLDPWHEQVSLGLDTFVEENSYWRSLCHAWSAHPAIEVLTRVLGVSPGAPGFSQILIQPHRCGLDHASGRVCTPRGPVSVEWRIDGDRFFLCATTPRDTSVRVRLPDGSEHESRSGVIQLECDLT